MINQVQKHGILTLDLSAYNTLSLSDLELTKEKIIQIDSTTLMLISRAQGFLLTITGDGMKMTAVIDHCIGCDAQSRGRIWERIKVLSACCGRNR